MNLRREPRAGLYAHARYERGLRAYRRRLRVPLLIVVSPMFAVFVFVVLFKPLDAWSVAAGVLAATGVAFISFTRDDPPQHVAKWGRGAEGERTTERALRHLEKQGWTVEHDLQRDGRANLDHVLTGPSGVFLLETKNLAGTISVEERVLVARQFDDPDEVYRYTTLASRLRGQASELSARLRAETGRRAWVNAAVVIWGHFPQGQAQSENVTYIAGDRLAAWLKAGGPAAS
jgi:nuclease-like protein